ncbi:hypothetical protein GCM10009111_17930 [Colwellia asteriadis]|uniref:Lipoprotein n=1 Tax=Colwellia asteriadis TaxID=517723 RepID=A0ABP3WG23_9GAMM
MLGKKFFILAGALSAMAALLHLACIYFGAPWYRFLGAGEQMALMAEQGSIEPTIITSFIAIVLTIWSLYAFSAAGIIRRLVLLRVVLMFITAVYLLRGVAGFFFMSSPMGRSAEFWLYSSLICLSVGLVHLAALLKSKP